MNETFENLKEVEPPWVMYPGYPPYDTFWRQSGEAWYHYIWRPYWDKLSKAEQMDYLKRWCVPREWWDFHLDPEFQRCLELADE